MLQQIERLRRSVSRLLLVLGTVITQKRKPLAEQYNRDLEGDELFTYTVSDLSLRKKTGTSSQ